MAASLGYVLSQLQRWTSPRLRELPDTVLLERFVGQRDESAFAALVARHGGMVLRSCRRILGEVHAAEDAFQATFLVLAQRAHALRQAAALPGFLHSVARRVSLKARAKTAACAGNSPLTEETADPRSDPLMQLTARELLTALDEEIARLPAAQRSALVLCCLEGHTREEAARILGCTEGAIKGHLQRGRQRLQKRLERRGIDLSAALALVLVAREGMAAQLPALLLQGTVRAALHGGSGGAASALAHSVLQAMWLLKLASVMAVALTLALAASTTVVLVYRGPAAGVPEDKPPQAATPPQAPQTPAARVDRFGDPLPEGALLRIGTIRYRAGNGINHAALSPDGKLLATACEEGITLFDLATGKPRHLRGSGVVNGFDDKGSNISFSPDGKQLVHVTAGGGVRFWDVTTSRLLPASHDGIEPPPPPRGGMAAAAAQHSSGFTKVWFPPQGKNVIAGARYVVIAGNRTNAAFIIEPAKGEHLRRFPLAGELTSVAADGKTLAAIDDKRSEAVLYDDRGKELRRFHHEGKIEFATLCQGGKKLVTVNEKSEIKIWDAATGKEQRTIAAPDAKSNGHGRTVVSIAPDGNTLFVGTTGGDILRWDLRDGKEQSPLCGHLWFVTGLFYTPDGRRLVSVSWDGVIRRWKLPSGKAEPVGEGYAHYLRVARSPDGRTIAAASDSSRLEFWDAALGKRLRVFALPAEGCSKMRFAPDGKLLALGCSDAAVRLWDIAKGSVRREWKLPAPKQSGGNGKYWFEGLAWSPDGQFLAASVDKHGLRMWQTETGKEIWHETRGGEVAFSPNGKRLVSGGWDAALTFQDAATGKVRFTLKDNRNVIDDIAFSPDGTTLATCHHGGNVYLRDPRTGVVRKTLQAHRGVAWSISFSPDSKWLASSGDNTVCIWEVATGGEVLCRKGHYGRAYQVEFGADGRTVLSSSGDLTALLWDIRPRIEGGRKRPLESLWADLVGEDAARAYQAIHQIAAIPNDAVTFIHKHLRPAPAVDGQRLARLIADLDSDEFVKRDKATAELQKIGECALPAYRQALESKPSLEMRRRLEELRDKAQAAWWDVSGERLRSLRAVEVLELAGTKEAREVLKALAAGASGARLTEEAKAALERLASRERDNAP